MSIKSGQAQFCDAQRYWFYVAKHDFDHAFTNFWIATVAFNFFGLDADDARADMADAIDRMETLKDDYVGAGCNT